ncbi:MAG: cysteine desulfurase family protein [Gemmatimonadales bacterium]
MNFPPVYLDHAATTPVRPEVLEAMLPLLGGELFGNPSSGHRFGRDAHAALEGARREVAAALGVEPGSVVFTSGGTEANNLAIIGSALSARDRGERMLVAVAATEHKAVLAAAHEVTHLGGAERVVPVTSHGLIDMGVLDRILSERPAVLSVMLVNNETGVIQPVAAIARRAEAAGVAFHSDLVQAFGKVPFTLGDHPIGLATISGHKIGAPKGIGALLVRDRSRLAPLIHGGSQQRGLRPGTENIAGAVGLGRAATLAAGHVAEESARLRRLLEELAAALRAGIPDLVVVGGSEERAPHVLNVLVPGTDTASLLMHLDLAGIAASGGSACATGAIEPSHVLLAMGIAPDLAHSAIRFSLGWETTSADIARAASVVPATINTLRHAAGSLHG